METSTEGTTTLLSTRFELSRILPQLGIEATIVRNIRGLGSCALNMSTLVPSMSSNIVWTI